MTCVAVELWSYNGQALFGGVGAARQIINGNAYVFCCFSWTCDAARDCTEVDDDRA